MPALRQADFNRIGSLRPGPPHALRMLDREAGKEEETMRPAAVQAGAKTGNHSEDAPVAGTMTREGLA